VLNLEIHWGNLTEIHLDLMKATMTDLQLVHQKDYWMVPRMDRSMENCLEILKAKYLGFHSDCLTVHQKETNLDC
jgi:hypothetical protein